MNIKRYIQNSMIIAATILLTGISCHETATTATTRQNEPVVEAATSDTSLPVTPSLQYAKQGIPQSSDSVGL